MTNRARLFLLPLISATCTALLGAGDSRAAQKAPLYVGWATADITPPKPVALVGQMHLRVSQRVDDPLTATVLALETKPESGQAVEQAVMVSCDLAGIKRSTQERLRQLVKARLDEVLAKPF